MAEVLSEKIYVAAPPKAKGTFFRAALGTAVPTDATTALTASFKDLGDVSDEGYTNSQSRDIQKKKKFGGATAAILQNDYTETVQVTLLDSLDLEVLRTVYGDDNVSQTPATSTKGAVTKILHNKSMLPKSVYVIDTVQGDGVKRQIIPVGQVTTVGDVVQVHTDTVQYTLTIECFEDENGDTMIEYIDDGQKTTGGGGS